MPDLFCDFDHVRSLHRAVAPEGLIGVSAALTVAVLVTVFLTVAVEYPAFAILKV